MTEMGFGGIASFQSICLKAFYSFKDTFLLQKISSHFLNLIYKNAALQNCCKLACKNKDLMLFHCNVF